MVDCQPDGDLPNLVNDTLGMPCLRGPRLMQLMQIT
jgi:hypothetical protein